MVEKEPDAYRTISEVSATIGVPQHILRFWETRFPQLKPLKRGGNRRYYRPADIALAGAIGRLLGERGFTVKGVQKLLAENDLAAVVALAQDGPAAAAPVADTVPAASAEVRRRLVAIRDRLAAALAPVQG
jgi:DNA-binding transcriptional MerR regulator